MNQENEQAQARWRVRAERHQVALRRYLDPPESRSARRRIDYELTIAEENLFASLPRKGLLSGDEVRAAATPEGLQRLNTLEIPKAPRVRDDFKVIPIAEWADAIAERKQKQAESRSLLKFILNQSPAGSCGAEGCTGALMACESKQGNVDLEILNPWAMYHTTGGGRDNGSWPTDNVAYALKYGVPSQRVWPRSKGWRQEPSEEAMEDALRHRLDEFWRVSDKEEFGTTLIDGVFNYAGYSGHAWFAIDPLDDVRFYWVNSGGPEWGDHGIGTLRYSSIAWGYGVWAFRTVTRPSPLT